MVVVNVIYVAINFRTLSISTFDPTYANTVGISMGLLYYSLMTMISMTAVASFTTVGAILSISFLASVGWRRPEAGSVRAIGFMGRIVAVGRRFVGIALAAGRAAVVGSQLRVGGKWKKASGFVLEKRCSGGRCQCWRRHCI